MTKPVTVVSAIAGLVLMGTAAQAQTATSQPETGAYVTLGIGGQPKTSSFGSSGTFSSFNETGRFDTIQNVGAGSLFDIGGGYTFMKHVAVGASVWNARAKSSASAAALIPDPVFFGRLTTVTADGGELKQSTLGVNLFVTYTRPLTDRFDVAVSAGPTIVRTRLDAASVIVTPNSQKITVGSESQSKTTAAAGNVGVDVTYRVKPMYNVGFFVRYAGGQVDLPAVQNLKVGSLQTGGLLRYRF